MDYIDLRLTGNEAQVLLDHLESGIPVEAGYPDNEDGHRPDLRWPVLGLGRAGPWRYSRPCGHVTRLREDRPSPPC